MRGIKFIVPAIILIGVVIFQSLFIVQEISQAIVLQFGDPKKIVTKAGLNFKLPFIQNVVYLDKRILNLDNDPEEVGKELAKKIKLLGADKILSEIFEQFREK